MKALKYQGPWNVGLKQVSDISCVEDDDVIVKVKFCGICGTDTGILTGDYDVACPGVTLGHEATGVVEAIGNSVKKVSVGDRVVINPTYYCKECRACKTGNENHCLKKYGTEAGVSYDGTFAEKYKAKEDFLRKLDEHVSFEDATLTEPLSCTITGVDKLNITNTNIRAVIIGSGPMGVLYAWSLKKIGVDIIMIENNAKRYAKAQSILPESSLIFTDFDQSLRDTFGKDDMSVDVVVDTSGAMTEVVLPRLSAGGKLLTIALKDKLATISTMKIADKSLSIIGSIDSLNNSFERAYCMIRDQFIPAEKIISHVVSLEDFKKGFSIIGCDIDRKCVTAPSEENCKVILKIS